VRRSLNAFNRADVEALMEVCTEDVPFLPARSALDGGYRGEAGLRRYFEDNAETLRSSRCDSTRFTEPEIASSRSAACACAHWAAARKPTSQRHSSRLHV
jgi:ketosteroid isomerase-like protein